MAKFIVSIDTDNAAFDGDDLGVEIAIILRGIADRVSQSISSTRYFSAPIRDSNGNRVGKYTFTK